MENMGRSYSWKIIKYILGNTTALTSMETHGLMCLETPGCTLDLIQIPWLTDMTSLGRSDPLQ